MRNIKKLLLGWGICVPLAYLIPKNKNLVLFMGRTQGEFFDNVKYLYLYLYRLRKSSIRYYFFTENRSVYNILKQNSLPAIYHPTLFSIYLLLRANVIVASSTVWIKKLKYHLLFRSKKVQIFHGLALKKVELGINSKAQYQKSLQGRIDNSIRGRFPVYDLLVSTSDFFTKHLFSDSFRSRTIIEAGYPRNDIFFNDYDDKYIYLGCDETAIGKIKSMKAEGYKVILYAPTFRDTTGDAISDKILDLNTLSEFAENQRIVFVFKFHLSTKLKGEIKAYDNIIWYDNSKDIQPPMKMTDIMVTDYSSVYLDFLLLDRPTIFFPYDYDKYITKDRELAFDYDWITSGPKCFTQDQLQQEILKLVVNQKDDYSDKRKEICDLAFKYKDGNASSRIWDFIKKEFLSV